MGNTPGGPPSGDLVTNQAWANEQVREHAQQRQQPAQETERPQEKPALSRDELQAAAIQRSLEENERNAEKNAQVRALNEAAQALAPKENPNRDQQLEQERQRGGREI
jgi:hypothetical protein